MKQAKHDIFHKYIYNIAYHIFKILIIIAILSFNNIITCLHKGKLIVYNKNKNNNQKKKLIEIKNLLQ